MSEAAALQTKRFAVALSFPGEVRDSARKLAKALATKFGKEKVFFDEWYEEELLGIDLDLKLRKIYGEDSFLLVPLFCKHYQKPWCEVEWSAIRSIMLSLRAEDRVIPISLDDTKINGWEKLDLSLKPNGRNLTELSAVLHRAHAERLKKLEVGSAPVGAASSLGSSASAVQLEAAGAPTPSEPTWNPVTPKTADQLRQKQRLTDLLSNDSLRKWLLKENRKPESLSADVYAGEILAMVPVQESRDQRKLPIALLQKAVWSWMKRGLPAGVTADDVDSLVSVLLPASVVGQLQQRLYQTGGQPTLYAVPTKDSFVAAALVANAHGLQASLQNEVVRGLQQSVVVAQSGKTALLGIGNPGWETQFAELLRVMVNSRDASTGSINRRLDMLHDQEVRCCIWVGTDASESLVRGLMTSFPRLVLIQAESDEETELNCAVLEHLKDIQDFLGTYK